MSNHLPVFLGRPNKLGCPWHGLVEGATLTLPNSDTKTWQAITGHGGCDVVRLPTPPSVSTTEEEEAQGMEWRNYALVTGGNRVFYGKALGAGHWIYLPGQGNAYHMRIVSTSTCNGTASGGSIGMTLGIKRLRQDGTTETERTISVGLTGIGQYQWGGADVTLQATLEAQSETGTSVLLKLTRASSHILAACGWLELTLTGDAKETISASLAIWRSRLQTAWTEYDYSATLSGPFYPGGYYTCASDRLYEHHYVIGGHYVGETLKEVRLKRIDHDVRSVVESGGTLEDDETWTRHLVAYLDDVEVCRTGVEFVAEATRETTAPATTVTFAVAGTWTWADGATEDMGLSIGNWNLYGGCYTPGSSSGGSDDATAYSAVLSADDYYHLKTPGLTNVQICGSSCANADPELPVVWAYAAAEGLASARYLGPGLVMFYGRMGPVGSPGNFESNRLMWRGQSISISAISFAYRADVLLLRAAGQPVTNAVAVRSGGIKETTSTTGTGTLTLAAVSGYSRFSDVYSVGQIVAYLIVTTLNGSYAFEWGTGTVGSGNTLTRNATLTRLANAGYSTSGAELDLVNASTVYCTALDMIGYV